MKSEEKIKISVIYITKDRKQELLRSIESCIKVKIDSMEIIIVDNASLENIGDEVGKLLNNAHIRFKYFYLNDNLGVSGGRNFAFSECIGKYVISLDDDSVISTDDFFNKIYIRMEENPGISAAALRIYEEVSDRYLEGVCFKKKNYSETQMYSYIGAGHVLRRKDFRDCKLYPERLMFGSEELYVALKIHKDKKILAYFDNIHILHLPSKINRVESDQRKMNVLVNTYLIRKYYYPKIFYPILYSIFVLRILKHKLLKYRSILKSMIQERYQPECMRTMNFGEFLWNFTRISPRYLF